MKLQSRNYTLADLIRLPYQASRLPILFLLANNLVVGLVPSLQVLAVGGFIDHALAVVKTGTAISTVVPWILAVVGLVAYSWIAGQMNRFAITRAQIGLYAGLRSAMIDKRARLMYRHIENPDTWDLIKRVSDKPEEKIGNDGLNNLFGLAVTILTVVGLLAILFSRVWWAALVIVGFSIPLMWLSIKAGKAGYDAEKETSRIKRKTDYLSTVLKDRENVEERSIFSYTDPLNDTWFSAFEKARKIELKVNAKWFIRMKTGGLIAVVIALLIAAVLLTPAINGKLSLGLYFALINAVFGLVNHFSWSLIYQMKQLSKCREFMKDLTAFAALEETPDATVTPDTPPPGFSFLEFREVSFTYPGTDQKVLDRLSFTMDAGQHYALVGINGAGKTTITKLLTGLYPEYEGEILVNGCELRSYTEAGRKALFSVVFQDFARYFIPLRDNIAVGGAHRLEDSRLFEAIETVGLESAIQGLPKGWDTPLGKIRKDGQDLSGGEWQRIAMARAMVNPAPLRILDEPTAALDPISESRVYTEFERMSQGKTTIFISHRLGSTALADRILVIDGGRVTEQGTHGELMTQAGLYARMYESQRSWYQ